jgi:hypothetical protein
MCDNKYLNFALSFTWPKMKTNIKIYVPKLLPPLTLEGLKKFWDPDYKEKKEEEPRSTPLAEEEVKFELKEIKNDSKIINAEYSLDKKLYNPKYILLKLNITGIP